MAELAAIAPLISAVGSLAGAFMGGGGAPSAPSPAPPPAPPEAPPPEPFVEPEGVQDEASTRARALRRRQESEESKGGLLGLSGEDSKQEFIKPKTLIGS